MLSLYMIDNVFLELRDQVLSLACTFFQLNGIGWHFVLSYVSLISNNVIAIFIQMIYTKSKI